MSDVTGRSLLFTDPAVKTKTWRLIYNWNNPHPDAKPFVVILDTLAHDELSAKQYGHSRLEAFIRINALEEFSLHSVTLVEE